MGISANAIFSQKAFVDFTKINYPLLSDRDGKVMQSFGVYDEARRVAKRSYVIIDKQGVIRYLHVGEGAYEQTDQFIRELLAER